MKSKSTSKKVLSIISYLQKNSGSSHSENKMWLLKMIYFADRYSIRNHGQAVSNDLYYAMKQGPVATKTFDTMNRNSSYLSDAENEIIQENLVVIKEQNGKTLELKSNLSDDDLLSNSDKEALDFAITNFGSFTGYQLSGITHDYPEWKVHKERFDKNQTGREDLDMKLVFENPDLNNSEFLKKHLNGKDPFNEEDLEYLAEMRNLYLGIP